METTTARGAIASCCRRALMGQGKGRVKGKGREQPQCETGEILPSAKEDK